VLQLFHPLLALGQSQEGMGQNEEAGSHEPSWAARLAVNAYFLKDQSDYLVPVAAVDHSFLHLEGRYNYEARHAGSVWVGWNLRFGETVVLNLTPMVGGVFGELNGMAPGLEWSLSWGPLSLYSEWEFVFDFEDSSGHFFYVWSEFSGQPLPWLRLGLALQRTRTFTEPHLLQWGPLVGFSVWKFALSSYWFNPGQSSNQYWVVSLGVTL
jgi:hypothetical protein